MRFCFFVYKVRTEHKGVSKCREAMQCGQWKSRNKKQRKDQLAEKKMRYRKEEEEDADTEMSVAVKERRTKRRRRKAREKPFDGCYRERRARAWRSPPAFVSLE